MNERWRGIVAVILAVGLAIAVSTITIGVLWEAVFHTGSSGLSENATQVLTTAFGGIIGVLGSYIGFKAGQDRSSSGTPPQNPPED